MRKKFVAGILFSLMVIAGFISCIGESGGITYQRYGVATLQPVPSLYTTDGVVEQTITSPVLEAQAGLREGDCFEVIFKADFTHPAGERRYEAEIIRMDSIEMLELEKLETTKPDSIATFQELFFTPSIRRSQLIENRLFLPLEMKIKREGQHELFEFQYSPDTIAFVGDRRVYDLYLKAIREGGTDTLETKWTETKALLLDNFIREAGTTEKQQGEDSLHFRLHYPGMYTLDSTAIRWTAAELYSIVL